MNRRLQGLIVEIIHISLVNSILKDGIVLPNSKILSIARTKLILQTDGMIFIEFIIEPRLASGPYCLPSMRPFDFSYI